MEALFLYFGKVILTSGVMFLYYQLFLKDKTFHHYNRFYLLGVMLISLLLPLLKVSYFTIEVNQNIYLLLNRLTSTNTNINNDGFNYIKIFAFGFGLVSFLFLAHFLYGVLKISKFKNQYKKEEYEGINFYQTNLETAPFSYFRNLFWKDSILINSDLGKQILKHEMVHIEQKHTFDKIFIEIIKAVFWFNPFFYLIKKEIHLIHEYLADKKAVTHSDTKAFAQMLLASHFSGNMIPATSPFLSSNLKKRLKMLKKPNTKYSYARRTLALPLLFALAFAYLVNAKNREIKAANIEIENAVKVIKQDTVSPKKEVTAKLIEIQEKPKDIAIKLHKSDKDIAELSKKIKEKSTELKTLAPNSKEFSNKIEEINDLSGKISDIATSQPQVFAYSFDMNGIQKSQNDIQEMLKVAQSKFNSKEFKEQLEKNKEYFNSKEFKDAFSKGKEYFNSPEWKEKAKELERMNFKLDNITFDEVDIKDLKDFPGLTISKLKDSPWAIDFKSENGKYNKTKLTEAQVKKVEKLAKKQAELAKKQAELTKERIAIEGPQNKVFVFKNAIPRTPNAPKVTGFKLDTSNLIDSNFGDRDEITYYIDGKLASKEEMQALKPNQIESVNVNKNTKDGKRTGELRIKLKK